MTYRQLNDEQTPTKGQFNEYKRRRMFEDRQARRRAECRDQSLCALACADRSADNVEATPRGFEPLRAEPNGFRVHLLNRSDTVSCHGGSNGCYIVVT